jgi:Spy/CpxP family protein refolding chaperone
MISSRTQIFVAIAALATLCVADVSYAQGGRGGGRGMFGPGGPGGGPGGMIALLGNEKVQQELELVDDQVKDIEELQNSMRDEMMQMFRGGGFRDMDPEERQAKMEEMRTKMEEKAKAMEAEVKDILLPAQFDRLKQLNFQRETSRGGTTGLADNQTIIEALNITDEQKEKMKEVAEAAAKKLEDKVAELRKQAESEVLGVLTDEQRAKYKELQGESFDFGQNQRGGPQGFQRGQRGGRGGNGGQQQDDGGATPQSDF